MRFVWIETVITDKFANLDNRNHLDLAEAA